MTSPEQHIHPHTKRNGMTFCLLGAGALLLILYVHHNVVLLPWPLRLTLLAFALITLALGVAKLLEPATSLRISPQQITFLHRKGQWQLSWDDILRFDIPRVHRGLELQELPFLGFRLSSYDALLKQLSPRLAVHLLMEQRQLMIMALRSEKPAHKPYTDYFDVPDYFKSESGQVYRGVLATFAVRMQLMRELLGYDLYISQNAFDRPLEEFKTLLVELQTTRQQHL
ncbi:DUF2982 domain-containing protein [Aliidiomarina minuta]|uniref:DUF2982 domain-containing protein n=1 Tax=Aliidiomarina minuta TaxID=880057 RepID=A0A432W8T4_9GAMM|nr:DUF2982 domain-containing protein [Aliidiomarina minuta]RUO26465.1 DUF2982 domain-containing protein [Aliidiomarina minuta]